MFIQQVVVNKVLLKYYRGFLFWLEEKINKGHLQFISFKIIAFTDSPS